jgi:hypothetical protein
MARWWNTRASTTPAPLGLWLATVAVTVFLVRVVAAGWQDGFTPFFPDSSSFAAVADRGPFWPRFWFDERPVGFPLLYWLTGRSPRAVVLVQSAAYAMACVGLVAALWRVLVSRAIAVLAGLVVVATCVQPRFAFWTTHVLSESWGLTTSIAAFAAWLLFGHRPDRRRLWWAIAASVAWVLTRDSHVVPFAVTVIPALAIGWRRTRHADPVFARSLLHATLLCVAVCGYVTVSQDVSDRNRYPVLNNVGQRILPDEEMTQWFADNGMPLDDAVRERTGASSFDDDFATLQDPDLAHLRAWADGPGQRTQLISFVVHAGFWTDMLRDDLPAILAGNLEDYDLFGVGERLPERLVWLDGPRTTTQLAIWMLVAVGALVLAAAFSRRRLLALVVALALASSWIELYLSYAGDSVEVHRHLVGPLLRLGLTMTVAVALGLDTIAARGRNEREASRPLTRRDVPGAVLVSLGTAAVLAAFFGNEIRSQDFDPQFARTIVERAGELGGTYYQNGIHNKGPFEMVVYDAARWVTSWGSYWFGISGFILILSLLLATVAALTARRFGAHPMMALAAAGGVGVHFALSTSDYAGVIYSRNITSALVAVVWALALVDRLWHDDRSRRIAFVVCGALLGLAVQTLLTTALVAVVVGGFVVARRSHGETVRAASRIIVSGLATVALAPVWYALRGSSDEFWAGWWTYARFMNSGTGRSLADQVGLGWTQLIGYVQDRPELVVVVLAFVLVTWTRWRRLARAERLGHATLLAWLLAASVELIVSQRYSSHYFSIVAVPVSLMMSVLAAHVSAAVVRPGSMPRGLERVRTSPWAAVIVVSAVLLTQAATPFWRGLDAASSFTGFADHADAREQGRGGAERSARAILDLVSDAGDPLMAWTMYPWTYLDQQRVPATRLSWKSFLLGEIYLGRSGPEYVLPQTWRWFAEDLAATDPAGFLTVTETPLVPGTPFSQYVTNGYEQVYPGPSIQVALRRDLLADVVGPVPGETWYAPDAPPPLWNLGAGTAAHPGATGVDPLALHDTGCLRLGADLRLDAADATSPTGTMVVRLVDLDGSWERITLAFDGVRGWSASDSVQFESVTVPSAGGRSAASGPVGAVPVVLVVGARSAALVADGTIVAAARIDGPVEVQLEASAGAVALSAMVVGPAPPGSGC